MNGVEENGHRADVHGADADAEHVGGKPGEFAAQHAQGLAARWQRPAHEFLDRTGVGHVVGERREVVQAVRVGHELVVVHVFGDFLIAAMQEADVRIGLGDDFAIEFEHQTQHAVGGRMGWAHVEDHALADEIVGLGVVALRSPGGAGDGVWGLDFSGGIAHAVAAGISNQSHHGSQGVYEFFHMLPRP